MRRTLTSLHYFYGKTLSRNTNTMMFSRNTLLAAAAAFYGASSVSAFAPSNGEYLFWRSNALHNKYLQRVLFCFGGL